MTTLTETLHGGAFIISEGDDGQSSRDAITVLSGEVLLAGAVLGKIKFGAATASAVTGTGTGAIGAVTVKGKAKVGIYTLTCVAAATNAGTFQVIDPDGLRMADLTVAVAYDNGAFAVTVGDATDFVVGDHFTITIAAGSGKYVELDPTAGDGSATAAGVLIYDCNATGADQVAAAIVRNAEVASAALVWFSGASAPQKATAIADLAKLGVIVR